MTICKPHLEMTSNSHSSKTNFCNNNSSNSSNRSKGFTELLSFKVEARRQRFLHIKMLQLIKLQCETRTLCCQGHTISWQPWHRPSLTSSSLNWSQRRTWEATRQISSTPVLEKSEDKTETQLACHSQTTRNLDRRYKSQMESKAISRYQMGVSTLKQTSLLWLTESMPKTWCRQMMTLLPTLRLPRISDLWTNQPTGDCNITTKTIKCPLLRPTNEDSMLWYNSPNSIKTTKTLE